MSYVKDNDVLGEFLVAIRVQKILLWHSELSHSHHIWFDVAAVAAVTTVSPPLLLSSFKADVWWPASEAGFNLQVKYQYCSHRTPLLEP